MELSSILDLIAEGSALAIVIAAVVLVAGLLAKFLPVLQTMSVTAATQAMERERAARAELALAEQTIRELRAEVAAMRVQLWESNRDL